MKHPTQSVNKSLTSKQLSLCAVLCAIALAIHIVEAQIPPVLPLPGMKPGIANIITLFAIIYLSPREAFLILIVRIFLGTIFSGQPSTLLYSLSGGIFCLLTEILIYCILGSKFIVEISIAGAMVHNTVQVICACLVTQTAEVFWYLPPLLIVGAVTGTFCGLCTKFILKYTQKK